MAMLRILSIETLLEREERRIWACRSTTSNDTKQIWKSKPARSRAQFIAEIAQPDLQQLIRDLADDVGAVDPNAVMMMTDPVARHPSIIRSARPVARPVEIVRLIANIDVKRNGVCRRRDNAAGAEQNRE